MLRLLFRQENTFESKMSLTILAKIVHVHDVHVRVCIYITYTFIHLGTYVYSWTAKRLRLSDHKTLTSFPQETKKMVTHV